MKTFQGIVLALLVSAMGVPAFAVETVETVRTFQTPAEPGVYYFTLEDFQRAYSGTKPIVAYEKFARARYGGMYGYPQTTLVTTRIRSDEDLEKGEGTKPHVIPYDARRGDREVIRYVRESRV
ncbi:MAG TPA: hypothetical protein VL688_02720 [Verrucomicrobiae bacterium]|nr:hypothetical protein [Verrucomicrobiae bacterium]